MMKKYLLCFMIVCGAFFLFCSNIVGAEEVIINKVPQVSDVVYGQPLFLSDISGGKASVDGVFYWKDEDKVLDVGVHLEKIIFAPSEGELNDIVLYVEINVLPRKVYLKFANTFYKQYDGSNRIEVPCYVVGGIIDKGVYLTGKAEAKVESVFVGENIKVNISGLEIKGDKKDNYYLDLEGNLATIHPNYIEEFGENKNRVSFNINTYVPSNSLLSVNLVDSKDVRIKSHEIKRVYSLEIKSNKSVVNVGEEVLVKIKIDEENLSYKRINLYNYYDDKFEKIDYEYNDGYLSYKCNGLGDLVVAQKKNDYTWIYMLVSVVVICLMFFVYKKINNKEDKINKYKSVKRRKDYGDCC